MLYKLTERRGYTLLWPAMLLACAAVAYLELFSSFRPYDDEGILMLSNRLFLAGYEPYAELSWLYGPAQLAWVQLVHGLLAVPITHEAVRYLTLLQWLAVALVSGWLVRSLTGSTIWGCTSLLLGFVYLDSIVNEPGHPQGLIALALLLVPLCIGPPSSALRGGRWLLVGVLLALVALVKPNAGLFALAGVAVSLASLAPVGRWRTVLLAGAVAGSLLFPFVLMLPFLKDPDCIRFAAISGLSSGAAAIVAFRIRRDTEAMHRRPVPLVAAGMVITGFIALSYAAILGIWPPDIATVLLDYAASQADFYHYFRSYSGLQVAMAGLSLVLATIVYVSGQGLPGRVAAKLAAALFVLAASYSIIIDDPGNAQSMLGWAMPWCWALIVSRPGGESTPARLLLALGASWSPLLAYPVPGSQLYFGCLPVLLAAVVCAADLARMLGQAWSARFPAGGGPAVLPHTISAIALLLAAILLLDQFGAAKARYSSNTLLDLPGTGDLRIEPGRARQYRALAEAADQHDVAFTTFRFNSLFFWTSAAFPGPGSLSQFPLDLASPLEKEQTTSDLLKAAGSALLIDRIDLRKARNPGTVSDLLDAHFRQTGRVGPYLLLENNARSNQR